MNAIDFTKIEKKKFNFYYFLSISVYLLFSFWMENWFFNTSHLFTYGMVSCFVIQFLIMELRLNAVLSRQNASMLQMSISFLSFFLNILILIFFIKYFNKNTILLGFLIAFNIGLINIVFISYFLSKQKTQ